MRDKIYRNLSTFSLLIAVLAFILHMIIPHDHHVADQFTNGESSCPYSNDATHNQKNFPAHCHICNDLTSEKAVISLDIRNIRNIDFTSDVIYPEELKVSLLISKIFSLCPRKTDSCFNDLFLLRAPPVA